MADEKGEEDLAFDDDTLTWEDVARALKAGEITAYTRQQVRHKAATISKSYNI